MAADSREDLRSHMRQHFPILALLFCFAMLLIAMVVLLLNGQKIEGLAALGFGSALTGVICTIGGISPPAGQHAPSQINNSPNAQLTNELQSGPDGQKGQDL
jgi:hypothetical protein